MVSVIVHQQIHPAHAPPARSLQDLCVYIHNPLDSILVRFRKDLEASDNDMSATTEQKKKKKLPRLENVCTESFGISSVQT